MTAGTDTNPAVFHYAAYGLGIRSEIPLPELAHATRGDDFQIRLTPPGECLEGRSIEWEGDPVQEARFNYPGLARFVVRGGRDLAITPHPDGDISLFRLYVQGMMLASALHQRGLFVLHSSVVDVNGSAFAFMGPIGAGKSTFASAFRALGHKVVADDNAALELDGARPLVLPAFPSVKIYPKIALQLGFEREALRPMHASQMKEAQCVSDAFSPTRLPLSCIYLLDREAGEMPVRVSPIEMITELLRHSVPTRWGVRGDGRHLKMCARLAKMVPLFRVRTFKELSEIQTIAGRIETHALRAAGGPEAAIE